MSSSRLPSGSESPSSKIARAVVVGVDIRRKRTIRYRELGGEVGNESWKVVMAGTRLVLALG